MRVGKDITYIKVLLVFGYLLILSSLFLILTSSSSIGYEYDIYQVYPNYFWVFLILSLFLGQCILVYYSISQITNRLWIAGLTLVIITNLILIFLPLIRGYFSFEDEDVFTHIGMMKDIIYNGYIGDSNIYPANHILGSIISLISGLNLHTVTLVIPGLFSILFMIGSYLFLRNIFSDQFRLLYGLSFALILYSGRTVTLFTPNAEAYLLLPFILHLIIESLCRTRDKNSFSSLSLIMGVVIVFWHPLILICLLIILSILFCLQKVHSTSTLTFSSRYFILYLMLIILCIFLSWNAYLVLSVKTIQPIIESILGVEEHTSVLQHYSTLASSANVPFAEIIRLTMDVYGQLIILVIMTILCSAIYFSTIVRAKNHIEIKVLFSLYAFGIFLLLSLFLLLMGGAYGFSRILLVSVLFSPIIIASVWGVDLPPLSDLNPKYVLAFKIGFILIVLLSINFFSIYNLYNSPLVKYPNDQVPESVFIGAESFFQARDDNLQILEFGLSQFRYYTAIYGNEIPLKNVANYAVSSLAPVDHFGYNCHHSVKDSYVDDRYLLITTKGRLFYPEIYPEYESLWRFTPDDFIRLSSDPGAHRLYYGGNLEVYLIQ